MCLDITPKYNAAKGRRDLDKLVGYKYYRRSSKRGFLESPYQRALISGKTGTKIISNRKGVKLSIWERQDEEVNQGIHLFLNKSDAIYWASRGDIITEISFQRRSVVAVGEFWNRPSLVVTRGVLKKKGVKK